MCVEELSDRAADASYVTIECVKSIQSDEVAQPEPCLANNSDTKVRKNGDSNGHISDITGHLGRTHRGSKDSTKENSQAWISDVGDSIIQNNAEYPVVSADSSDENGAREHDGISREKELEKCEESNSSTHTQSIVTAVLHDSKIRTAKNCIDRTTSVSHESYSKPQTLHRLGSLDVKRNCDRGIDSFGIIEYENRKIPSDALDIKTERRPSSQFLSSLKGKNRFKAAIIASFPDKSSASNSRRHSKHNAIPNLHYNTEISEEVGRSVLEVEGSEVGRVDECDERGELITPWRPTRDFREDEIEFCDPQPTSPLPAFDDTTARRKTTQRRRYGNPSLCSDRVDVHKYNAESGLSYGRGLYVSDDQADFALLAGLESEFSKGIQVFDESSEFENEKCEVIGHRRSSRFAFDDETSAKFDIGDISSHSDDEIGSVTYIPTTLTRRKSSKRKIIEPWQPSLGRLSLVTVEPSLLEGEDLIESRDERFGQEPPLLPLDVSRLHRIAGYEDLQHYKNSEGPPITPPLHDTTEQRKFMVRLPEDEISNVGFITEEEAHEALMEFVTQSCCYGKSAAKEMDIYKINQSNALHDVPMSLLQYTLETFMENRSTGWDQEPYTGQKIDGPSQGPAPLPWDIHCNPTQMFHSEVRFLEVPHTATVTCCHNCSAMGWIKCHGCMGKGYLRCLTCCGSGRVWKSDPHGRRLVETCWHCHGTGRKRCSYCGGDGRVVCKVCQGYRNLKCYIKLRVEYKNNLSEHIIENTDLPSELIKNVTGEYVLEQTQPKVYPIRDYPHEELCIASQTLLQQHMNNARNSRILIQRQKLRVVAVTECSFAWINTEGRFWVYGKELAVYTPDYPQKHCWGCAIL